MNYIFFFQDIFINLLILFSSFFILIKINFLKNININEVVLIFFVHTFFMMLMIFYGTISPSDSNFYWNSVDNFDFENLLSSGFMKLLLIFLKKIINISYSNLMFLINFFGTLGILFFLDLIKPKLQNKRIIVYCIISLPSFYIWTNTFIKESLLLPLIFIFLWMIDKKDKYIMFPKFILLVIFFIRPYLGLIISLPYLFSFYFRSRYKIILFIPLLIILFLILFILNKFFSIHALNFSLNFFSILDEIFNKYKNVIHGSLIINVDRNFIVNMFSYLFSPIFYFKYLTNPMIFLFLLENLLIIIIFYILISNFNFKIKIHNLFYLLSFLLLLFITAETTTNAGIVLRQKWPILIFFIYILIDGQKKSK